MLMKKDQIGNGGSIGGGDKVGEDQCSTVESNGGRQEKADLFGESGQACGGRSRGGDQRPWIYDTRQMCIFIVNVLVSFRSLVEFVIFPQPFVIGNGWI